MDSPGVFPLAVQAITAPLTAQVFTPITGLGGIQAANLVCALLGAAGGSSIDAVVQTSFDGGTTWYDVAHFSFTTSPGVSFAVLNALASKGVASYSALSEAGVNDGLLGDQMRAVITSTGTYTNTAISLYVHAK